MQLQIEANLKLMKEQGQFYQVDTLRELGMKTFRLQSLERVIHLVFQKGNVCRREGTDGEVLAVGAEDIKTLGVKEVAQLVSSDGSIEGVNDEKMRVQYPEQNMA